MRVGTRCLHLFGKRRRHIRKIESLCCEHGRSLVIAMVFAGHIRRQPSEDHVGPGESHESHHFFKGGPVTHGLERVQHILRRCVLAIQEPYVGNSAGRAG